MLIRISGVAAVFDENDEFVSDRELLGQFDGYVYDNERFTDYLGGPPLEDTLAELLEPGGHLLFTLASDSPLLRAVTEYRAPRRLADSELGVLLDYTMGQWSDGIGENIATETWAKTGLSVQCQTDDPVPMLEQLEEET